VNDSVNGTNYLRGKNTGGHAGKRAQPIQAGGNLFQRRGVERGTSAWVPCVESLQDIGNFGTPDFTND